MTSLPARVARTRRIALLGRVAIHLALAGCVIAIYLATVTLAGLVVPDRASLAVSLLAAGVVAVLVQPVRARLQAALDRLLYGRRENPYAVVSQLGQRLQATVAPEATLAAIVETVAAALRLPFAAIELTDAGRVIATARFGEPADDLERVPLIHRGETLGALVLAPRGPLEWFGPADHRLIEVLARQVGVAAHAARLTGDLQRSRERLVAAREEERRRLRRDLHDGLGPLLAAMTLRLDAAANLVGRDAAAADELLAGLVGDVRRVRLDIRRLVDDLRPPALDEFGLAGAIRDGVGRIAGPDGSDGPAVSLELAGPLPDLPAAVEVAAYRIALEAVTNVVRHAGARTCRVRLELAEEAGPVLVLAVEDDGRGLPPDLRAGVGLVSMRERATELGGQWMIGPGPGGGTRLQARLPLPAAPAS